MERDRVINRWFVCFGDSLSKLVSRWSPINILGINEVCPSETKIADAAALDDLGGGLVADGAHPDDEFISGTSTEKLPFGVSRGFDASISHVDMQKALEVEDIMALDAVEF